MYLNGLLPSSANGRRLAVVALVDSVGSGMFLSASVVLFATELHLRPAQIGYGLAIAGIAGLLCAVPWGAAADRFGARRILVLLQFWRAIGFVGYVFVDNFTGYLAVTIFLGIAEKANAPLTLTVAAHAVPAGERVSLAAYLRSVRNGGFTAGALLSALALLAQDRLALMVISLGNAATFVAAAVLLLHLPTPVAPTSHRAERVERRNSVLSRPAFCTLAALSGLISVHRSLLAVGLPLWIVTRTSAPHSLVTLLIGMNTVLVMLLQVRFASTANGLSEAAHAVRRAGVALLLFSALISFSAQVQGWLTVGVLVAATVALTTGELWHSAGAWGLSLALAPQQARGRFLTVFNLGATVLDITGAVIVTSLVLPAGDAGWLALGGLLTIAGFLAVPATRWAAHEVALAPVEPAGRR